MFESIMRFLNFVMEFVYGVFKRLFTYLFILIFGIAIVFGSFAFLAYYAATH